MKRYISKTVVLVLVFLVLFGSAHAQDDFLAYSKNPMLSVCPCGQLQDNITIINPANTSQEFYASVSGSAESFITINPSHFRLRPKQKAYIISSIDVPCATTPGSYVALIKLKTNASLKGFKQTVVVQDSCFDYSVFLGKQLSLVNTTKKEKFLLENEFPYNLCQQENSVIPVYLQNNGSFSNTFSVSLESKKWASLYYSKVDLKPQQGAVLFINIFPPKDLVGDFTFVLRTKTENLSVVQKDTPITFRLDNCYTPIIAQDIQKVKLNYSTIRTVLSIKNTGIKNASYILGVTGEDWVTVQPSQLFIEPGMEKDFFLQTNPGEEIKSGTYKATISATVEENGVSYSKELHIKLGRFAPLASLQNIFGALQNFFKGYVLYVFIGVICILIFILIFISITRRRKKVEEIDVKHIEEKAEELDLEIEKEPWKISWGTIVGILILAALIYGIYLFITKIPWKEIFGWIFGFLGLYKWYIIGACTLLVIMILIMLVIRKIKRQSEKQKAEKEEELQKEELKEPEFEIEKEPRKIPWGTIVGILVLVAIIYGIYLFITKIPWKEIFGWIFGFLGLYKWYILGALSILVLVIIVMILIKRFKRVREERKQREREERQLIRKLKIKANKEKTEKIVKEKKTIPLKLIAFIIIVALVAFCSFYFSSYLSIFLWYILIGFLLIIIIILGIIILRKRKKKQQRKQKIRIRKKIPFRMYIIATVVLLAVIGIGFLYTIGLKSQIKEQENATLENASVALTPLEKGITLKLYENTEKDINLNDYFRDPDKADVLHYVVTPPKNFTITIDEKGIASIVPEEGWTGTTSAVFVADDGRGGIVDNKITLVVENASPAILFFNRLFSATQQFISILRKTIIDYSIYIISGFIILVCLILLIKFHKPILDFFEEEAKPAKHHKKK